MIVCPPVVVVVGTTIARSQDLGVIIRLCYQNDGYVEKTELSASLNT